jgi:hypothetical protein
MATNYGPGAEMIGSKSRQLTLQVEGALSLTGHEEINSEVLVELIPRLTTAQESDVKDWLSEVDDEKDFAQIQLRDPEWPTIPDCLAEVITPAATPTRPKAETRTEAISRLQDEMQDRLVSFTSATDCFDLASNRAKIARKLMDATQEELNLIVTQLCEVRAGGDWQPRLHFPSDVPAPTVDAAADPVIAWSVAELETDRLTERLNRDADGTTPAITDKIVEAGLGTIGDLEAAMRDKPEHWYQSVTGFGPIGRDRVLDALESLRNGFPMPDDEVNDSDATLMPAANRDDDDELITAEGEKLMDLRIARQRGADAFCNGEVLADCPYAAATDLATEWKSGFNKGNDE